MTRSKIEEFALALDRIRGLERAADPRPTLGDAIAIAKGALDRYAPHDGYRELPKDHVFTGDEQRVRAAWARRFIPQIAGVARGLGYAVFHGGSLIRDIDLVAVPWQSPTARPSVEFVLDLCQRLNLTMGNHGQTIFGHRWFALWDKGHRDHQIDLKVILPGGDEIGGGE